jgi:hypothetical protein
MSKNQVRQLAEETNEHFKTGHLAVSICNNTKFFLIKNNGQTVDQIEKDIETRSKFLKIRLSSVIARGL